MLQRLSFQTKHCLFFFSQHLCGVFMTQRQILRSLIDVTSVSFLPNVHVTKFAFIELEPHSLFFRNCNFTMKNRKAPWPLHTQSIISHMCDISKNFMETKLHSKNRLEKSNDSLMSWVLSMQFLFRQNSHLSFILGEICPVQRAGARATHHVSPILTL